MNLPQKPVLQPKESIPPAFLYTLKERSGQSVCEGQFGSGVCGAREQSKLVIFSAFLFSSSAYFRKGWELTWFTTNVVNGSQHSQKNLYGHNINVSILKSTSF